MDKKITPENNMPIYLQISDYIRSLIQNGTYAPEQKISSETELGKQFQTTRATVGKALRDLEIQGLITRRRGSGSYVSAQSTSKSYTFGLLIPNLGKTEIFEPICSAIAIRLAEQNHRLLWGQFSSANMEERSLHAERLCRQYIEQKVDGVFFAPIELASAMDKSNARIASLLEKAGIPIILLDCDIVKFPKRSHFDLIGIDNRRVGYMLASHFLEMGCRRIDFVCRQLSAQTIEARIAGYIEALRNNGIAFHLEWIHRGDPDNPDFIKNLLQQDLPEAIICGNDDTAAHLLNALLDHGVHIPDDIKIAGVDDVKYASMLAVPLTTVRQPCEEMGRFAVEAMIKRIGSQSTPGLDILFDVKLMVRKSSGCKDCELSF